MRRVSFSNASSIAVIAILFAPLLQAQTRAGAAKVDITPDVPVALAGYSEPQARMSEGVHDRLYARAIAFRSGSKKLVLVSCDLSGFQTVPISYFRKDLLARFQLEPGELFLCGTHTHSAPMLFLNSRYPHPNNFSYTEGLKAKLLEAVGKALNSAAPARLGVGIGSSKIAVNRRLPPSPGIAAVSMGRNPDGLVDRDVLVLKIAHPNGDPVAALFDYACHARSLRSANRLVSGDIFGIAEQFVERSLGRAVVSPAFAGASGDIDPWDVVPGFNLKDDALSETVLQGNSLGEEVVRVFRGVTDLPAGAGIESRWAQLALPGKTAVKYLEMSAARVGDVAFLGVDCEALVEIGKEIRQQSPFRHTFIFTNCNGGSGYLPPAHLYAERGYEVDLSGFAPEAAGMVVQSALKMLASLRR